MGKINEIIISAEEKPNDNDYQYLIKVNGELDTCDSAKHGKLKICLIKGMYFTEEQDYTLTNLMENIILKADLTKEYAITSDTDIIDIDLWRNKVGL